MKRQIFGLALFALLWTSCQQEDPGEINPPPTSSVQFNLGSSADGAGRKQASNPVSVKVTVKNSSGVVVANGVELSIVTFGGSYLTAPLTLTASGNSYQLTEFVVLNADHQAIYATPVEGSEQARFVNDPLSIGFTISATETTVVRPEVIAVTDATPPVSFGYGQFDFKVVEKISVILTGTKWGQPPAPDFDFQLMVEGFESENSAPSWVYHTTIFSTGLVELRKSHHYRLTAMKPGYSPWSEITTFPHTPGHVDIILTPLP